jgi:Tfp pilus assembly protein PilO
VTRRGPLLAAGVGVVIIIGMVAGLIVPKASAIRSKQAEVAAARAEESTLRLQLQQLEAAAKGADKARKKLTELDAEIPPTADLPGLIRLLNTTAAQADLDFISLAPGQPTADLTGRLSAVPIQVTVIGGFFAVEEYFVLLEDLPRVSKVLSIDLGPGPEALPQLQVNAAVEFYTTDVSAGPGSIPGPTSATAPSQPQVSATPGPGAGPTPTPGG